MREKEKGEGGRGGGNRKEFLQLLLPAASSFLQSTRTVAEWVGDGQEPRQHGLTSQSREAGRIQTGTRRKCPEGAGMWGGEGPWPGSRE